MVYLSECLSICLTSQCLCTQVTEADPESFNYIMTLKVKSWELNSELVLATQEPPWCLYYLISFHPNQHCYQSRLDGSFFLISFHLCKGAGIQRKDIGKVPCHRRSVKVLKTWNQRVSSFFLRHDNVEPGLGLDVRSCPPHIVVPFFDQCPH